MTQSEAKYTPGPWSIAWDKGDKHIRDASGVSLMCDTDYYPWVPGNDADWKLIAAAPEFAEAAMDMVVRHDDQARRANFANCGCLDCTPARAALQKAGLL